MNQAFTFEKCVSDVAEFHAKFGIAVNPLDNASQADLRIKRLDEEFEELSDSIYNAGKMRDTADAVIDIIYIAAGTYHLLGDRDGSVTDHINLSKDALKGFVAILQRQYNDLPLQALWDEVHSANMRKERGTEGTSKYGNKFDIVKPAGWVPPFLDDALNAAEIDPSCHSGMWHKVKGLVDVFE